MQRLPFLFYVFFFQAAILAAFGATNGEVGMMCSGLGGFFLCTAILLKSRQAVREGTVQPFGMNGQIQTGQTRLVPLHMPGGGSSLDRYQSVLARLRLAPASGQTSASLVNQHKRWFNGGEQAARAFFNHPQVVKALNLDGGETTTTRPTQTQVPPAPTGELTADLVNDTFWGNLEDQATQSVPAADGVCGMAHCSNEVNAFSFQCFQCRRRVCSPCGNSGVLCRTCAS